MVNQGPRVSNRPPAPLFSQPQNKYAHNLSSLLTSPNCPPNLWEITKWDLPTRDVRERRRANMSVETKTESLKAASVVSQFWKLKSLEPFVICLLSTSQHNQFSHFWVNSSSIFRDPHLLVGHISFFMKLFFFFVCDLGLFYPIIALWKGGLML